MSTKWFENDAFWEAMAPALFTKERWAQTEEEVDAVLAILELPPGARILDLCCGPGRHSIELARRGFRVTAVDRTRPYLVRAQAMAKEERLEIEFVQSDMREVLRPEEFDAALNLFTSFGFFEDPEEDFRVVQNLHASLKPGGQLLFELMGKETLAGIFKEEREWRRLTDGSIFLEDRHVQPGWDWVTTEWTILTESSRFRHTFGLRPYSAVELTALVRRAGFTKTRTFGELATELPPYDHEASRLVLHTRRD